MERPSPAFAFSQKEGPGSCNILLSAQCSGADVANELDLEQRFIIKKKRGGRKAFLFRIKKAMSASFMNFISLH